MDLSRKKKTGGASSSKTSTGGPKQQHKKVKAGATGQNVSPPSSVDTHDDGGQSTSSSHLIQPFQKHLNLGGDVEEENESPSTLMDPPANLEVPTGSDLVVHEKTEDFPQENSGGEHDRMGDDGYPLVVDLGTSERQSRLARQRLIDEVIQDQAFDQDVIEELERANMRRVFEEIEEGEDAEHAAMRRRATANGIVSGEDCLTPRVEAAIANYMVRKYADSANNANAAVGIAEPEEPGPSSSGLSSRPVNIVPVSHNLLEHPANNIISVGRRSSPVPEPRSSRNLGGMSRRAANAVDDNPLGWQGAKTTLKERISYMYCKDVLADVYFTVGKDDMRQRIPAHKFVLSIGSVVFDAMFNGGLTPQNSRDPLEIELPDVEVPAFRALLRFLYSDEVEIGPESVMTTLYTAKKYAVPAMESACVEFLKQSLGADNAFMLLTQARLFDEPQLAKLCLEIIDKNTAEALNGEGFTDIDLEALCLVLARDTLRVKEAQLFQAVVRWSTEECARRGLEPTTENRRAVLGRAVQLIRFPLMTVEEFAQSAAQSGLLTDREVVNLFLYFTVNPKPSIGFNDNPRCSGAGKELVVSRFQRIEGRWGYSGTPDRIKFTVDRKIFVVGFGLYGAIHGPHEYQCVIQIIHCGTGKVLAQNDTSFVCDGSSSTCRVSFRVPVEITPGVTYIASACLKGMDSHYGTKGLRRIVHQSAAGGVVTFQFTYAAGNNNGTSVEDGQIPEIIFYTSSS
uniref:BTB domain-containing protein n=1 Tax=Haemonchus contortus TaxID=6289 RepID=A0A7I4YK11_HAECO